jgi:hypothetical protein
MSPIVWEKGISSESMKKAVSLFFGPIGHVIFDMLVMGCNANKRRKPNILLIVCPSYICV